MHSCIKGPMTFLGVGDWPLTSRFKNPALLPSQVGVSILDVCWIDQPTNRPLVMSEEAELID